MLPAQMGFQAIRVKVLIEGDAPRVIKIVDDGGEAAAVERGAHDAAAISLSLIHI